MDERDYKAMNKDTQGNGVLPCVSCRYLLYSEQNLNAKLLGQSNNKQELKIKRTWYRYQMLMLDIGGEIYDTKNEVWIP